MQNKRTFIIGIVLGIIAVILVNLYIAQARPLTVSVLQYVKPMQKGALVSAKDVKRVSVPKDFLGEHDGLVRDGEQNWVVGQTLTRDVEKEDFVDVADVAPSLVIGLPDRLCPECRALTLHVNEESGVGGYLEPGDMVDLVVTLKQPRDEQNPTPRIVTKTLLQKIKILAVGDRLERGMDRLRHKRGGMPPVTLELTPRQVERVLFAREQAVGPLTLVLTRSDAPEVNLPSVNWSNFGKE